MAFKATFSCDGKDYSILHCNYSMHQNVDANGRPSSDVRGGMIHVTVEANEDTSLFQWMIDSHSFKEGKIVFYKRDSDSRMKELDFSEAACIEYSESFDSISASPMTISFTLSAARISIGDAEHTNAWFPQNSNS
jgi:hypothetical protein